MATTSDTRTFARALYETLLGTALDQLQAAAPKLAGVSDSDPQIAQRITAALPANSLPEVRNFLMVLANEGALQQLPDILKSFEGYLQGVTQEISATVTSAVALAPAQQERITADLRERYGSDLTVSYEVDQTLIGGLVIRVGDQVLDNSLRTRLSAVQRNMLSS